MHGMHYSGDDVSDPVFFPWWDSVLEPPDDPLKERLNPSRMHHMHVKMVFIAPCGRN